MKLLRIVDKSIIYPYSIEQLNIDFPNTSFPENLSTDTLLEFGVHQVLYIAKPNEPLKNISEWIPTKIGKDYYESWVVTECTTDEINIRLDLQWSDVRYQRNQYLSECDWTQLIDSPLSEIKKSEWNIYRQGLRDIPTQSDPFNIKWPIKPQ